MKDKPKSRSQGKRTSAKKPATVEKVCPALLPLEAADELGMTQVGSVWEGALFPRPTSLEELQKVELGVRKAIQEAEERLRVARVEVVAACVELESLERIDTSLAEVRSILDEKQV